MMIETIRLKTKMLYYPSLALDFETYRSYHHASSAIVAF